VATKFDLVVSKVLFDIDIAGGDTRLYERAKGTAHAKYEESRRSLFRGNLRDVPVEIISSQYLPLNAYRMKGHSTHSPPSSEAET